MDAIVSASTIVAAVIHLSSGVGTEAWLAAAIALLICSTGVKLLFSTVSKLLGERIDPQIISQVEDAASEIEGVKLASGITLQDFGPERLHGTLYVTVDGSMTVEEFDEVARKVQVHALEQCGVKLTSVGVYALGSKNPDESEVCAKIGRIVWTHDDVVELRGLFADAKTKQVRFDAVAGFGRIEHEALRRQLVSECEAALPGWSVEARVLDDI
ncbi:MAG: hypothetical protein J6D34_11965 [Atopobiaceae bacterium]|nr:hypothetical protein [Atopobiaceae bacterium]